MALQSGQMIDNRYRVVKTLGQGGMGAVYRCWDIRLNRPVALKEMLAQPGLEGELLGQLLQQFEAEAQTLATLSHPNLVRVTDYFFWENSQYLVMDYVEGESLADRIRKTGPQPEAEVVRWAVQLLSALAYCHKRGILHRDIKPQNIIINPEGEAVLVDFGLVKLWDPSDPHTKTVMRGAGTPEYAPPEQYDAMGAGHTDPRSDIYSLGATLYHAVTGKLPPTATQRMANPASFAPPRALNALVSADCEQLILQAMSVAMPQRFQSAEEMKDAFLALGGGRVVSPSQVGLQKTVALSGEAQPEAPGGTQVIPQPHVDTNPPPLGMAATPAPYAAPAARPKSRKGLWIGLALAVMACVALSVGGVWLIASWANTPTPTVAGVTPVETTAPPTQGPRGPQTLALAPDGSGDFPDLPAAVAAVEPGGVINLGPGTYTLQEPLIIDKPLTLAGAGIDETFIVSGGQGYVVRYSGDGRFAATDITFRHEGDVDADAVRIDQGEIEISRCRFTGAVWAEGNDPHAGLHILGGAQGRVQDSEALANNLDGIRVENDAHVDLLRNTANDNAQYGIHFRDSARGQASDNHCTGNALGGIGVLGSAQPVLENNTLSGNDESGIVYWGNGAGEARRNTCRDNGLHGISLNDNAAPLLQENQLISNTQDGLVYFGSAAGVARHNTCNENGLHGIGVNGQAQPTLDSNICSSNAESGIRYSDESSGLAQGNECTHNTLSGIIVTNSATPTLDGNFSNENTEDGLAYFESAGGIARNNVFSRNGLHGIDLYGDTNPTLESNICDGNQSAGIRFSGNSTATATNNELRNNLLSGIIVREAAAPTLEGNIAYDNTENGLAYFGTAAGVARYNTFRGNTLHGISVNDTAQPTLESNTCTNNVETGISYFNQGGGIARQNELTGSKWGVYVAATASPNLIDNNIHDNDVNVDDRR